MTEAHGLDLKVWPIFHAMSERGIAVSMGRLADLLAEADALLAEEQAAVEALTNGQVTDPGLSRQVAGWMEKEGLHGKKTTSGQFLSTDERSLRMHKHPAIDHILEHRGIAKLMSTFIGPTMEAAAKDMETDDRGIIHINWKLTRVRSGRVASEDPNLLAFPSRDAWGKKLRACFIPRPGYKLASVDYSQLEPRVVAWLSRDKGLLDIYDPDNEQDLYTSIAAALNISRQAAKVVTLGVLYGMGAKRLQEQLALSGMHVTVEYCQELIDRWFAAYPGVQRLIDSIIALAKAEGGWVRTEGGRGRFLPGLFLGSHSWPENMLRFEAERQAFNHVIQGTGMEMLKRAMTLLEDRRLLLAIHDELVFEIPDSDPDGELRRIADVMYTELPVENTDRRVILRTSHSWGDDWGSVK